MTNQHLSVPWFLGDVVEKIGKRPSQLVYHWDSVIQQVLGGTHLYKKFTHSPVGHHIDFELLTDPCSNELLEWESNSAEENVCRHIILIESNRHFCMVRKDEPARRLGRHQKVIGHLRKLGYLVLEMPEHEWPRRRTDYEAYFIEKLAQANIKVAKRDSKISKVKLKRNAAHFV